MKPSQNILFLTFISFLALGISCNSESQRGGTNQNQATREDTYRVTFIEIGSKGCIPCAQMRLVMNSIEAKFGSQVKVEFYDVRTDSGAPYAKKYGITDIPTQIFLDRRGKEYFRHVGYFPEEELVKVLQQKGVK